jgi:hypothetical protein
VPDVDVNRTAALETEITQIVSQMDYYQMDYYLDLNGYNVTTASVKIWIKGQLIRR